MASASHIVMHIWVFMCVVAFSSSSSMMDEYLLEKHTVCLGSRYEARIPVRSRIVRIFFRPKKGGADKNIYKEGIMYPYLKYILSGNILIIKSVRKEDEGIFKVQFEGGRIEDVGTLSVKACAFSHTAPYGDPFVINATQEPVKVLFYPRGPGFALAMHSVWSNSKPDNIFSVSHLGELWEIKKDSVTKGDEGKYEVWTNEGPLSTTSLVVEVKQDTKVVEINQNIDIQFPRSFNEITLLFVPRNQHLPQQTLVVGGNQVSKRIGKIESTGVTLLSFKTQHSGIYKVLDKGQHLAQVQELITYHDTKNVVQDKHVDIIFPHHRDITLLFIANNRPDHKETLVAGGRPQSRRVGDVESTRVTLLSLQPYHSGIYTVLDLEGILVKSQELVIETHHQESTDHEKAIQTKSVDVWYIVKLVLGIAFALVFFCKCCALAGSCDDDKGSDGEEEAPNREEGLAEPTAPWRPPRTDDTNLQYHYNVNPPMDMRRVFQRVGEDRQERDNRAAEEGSSQPSFPTTPRTTGGLRSRDIADDFGLNPLEYNTDLSPPTMTVSCPEDSGLDAPSFQLPPSYDSLFTSGPPRGTSALDMLNSQLPLTSDSLTNIEYTSDKLL